MSYEEAKWVCNYFWRTFIELSETKLGESNFEAEFEKVDFTTIVQHSNLLEEALRFGQIAAFMVEADLQER